MAFAEDLSVFLDTDQGFAVDATLGGSAVQVIFDAPGAELLGGDVASTEPSALVAASEQPAVADALVLLLADLPAQLAHLAGTYAVRSLLPEPPDGAFVRLFLVKN